MSRCLAIDQGGHASRAILFDAWGRPIATAERSVTTLHPAPDRVEHDAEGIVTSVRQALDALMREAGGEAVAAAGLGTQRSSVVCWDRLTGKALSPVISWQDRRAADALSLLESEQGDIQRRTGLRLSPHYGASKLRWCLDHLPAVASARDKGRLACGPLASFLLFRLLENHPLFVDPANAQRTQLWNISSRDWDEVLLARFGVPRACLPACVATRHPFGALFVRDTGIPLTICEGDQPAALFADGMPQGDCAYINMGTGAFVQRVFDKMIVHRQLLTSLVWEQGNERVYVLEGTVNGAGAALEWLALQRGIDDITNELPLWLMVEDEPPLFLNGVGGLGSPFWVAGFESRFIGYGSLAQHAVAVAESIVFLIQTNLDELAGMGSPLARVVVTGGLSQIDGLCQRMADLCQLPVWRPVAHEATARGLACLAAGVPDEWQVADGECFEPQRDARLRERYARWRSAMGAALSSP